MNITKHTPKVKVSFLQAHIPEEAFKAWEREVQRELLASWPKGHRLAHTPSGACFVPNGSMTRQEFAEDREYEVPTYQLETRNVVIDVYTGEEVDIDLSYGDFFGRYARKTFYVR